MTIDSFLSLEYPSACYEIIIVDNNSSDATKTIVQRYLIKESVLVQYFFEARQGVHYARNTGAKHAVGEILYFTDDDMLADPLLLKELVKVFALDPDIASATGKIIGKFDEPPPRWVDRYLINAYLSLTEKNKPEDLVVSCNDMVYSCHQAIRSIAFFAAGGFNPENTAGVWIGDGETGLGIKLSSKGYKFAYTSRSIIYHMIPRSRTTLLYLIKRIGNQGLCDSYTDFRGYRDKDKIIQRMIWRNITTYPYLLSMTILKIILNRESWRFIFARMMYVYMRNRYDLKIFFDDEFRELVIIDNWIL